MSVLAAGKPLDNLCIRASAGSGKTYQLTNRYLGLLARGASPRRILASTFTRLAAGEIRARILMRLVDALDDKKKRKDLTRGVWDDDAHSLSRDEVLALLVPLARQIDALNIRTLDSFFTSIVTGFALELGVPPGATVVDEHDAALLREEAIDLLLDERKPQDLIELLRLLTQGKSDRDVTRTIRETVDNLFALHSESAAEAWNSVPRPDGALAPDALNAALERLAVLPLPKHKSIATAHDKSVQAVRDRDWESFLGQGYPKNITLGSDSYYQKEITPDIIAAYAPLMAHARAVLIGRVIERNDASRRLLDLFAAQFGALKRDKAAITFRDLITTLDTAEFDGALADIAYRIDSSIDHMLLDEFQDTSIPQWRVLSPMARELASDETSGRTFFCVGDIKQSIYGFRDAAPEVMENLSTLLYGDETTLDQQPLAKSWRSSVVIMDAVNRVFQTLTTNDALHRETDAEVAAHWQSVFEHHETAKKLPGYVELRTVASAGDDDDKSDLRLRHAATIAATLNQAAPNLSIGILTRTNAAGARILFELNQLGAPATGRGGGPLTDAAPVNVLLDVLLLADHPQDTAAAFNVATSPLAVPLEIPADLAVKSNRAGRRRISGRVRTMLRERGLAGTLRSLVAMIAPACSDRDLRRVCHLVQQAERFEELGDPDISHFIDQAETRTVADAQPSPIEVLTVHGSKGLEFDAVILPELDGLFDKHRPSAVSQRNSITGPVTRICTHINKTMRGLIPEVEDLFDTQTKQAVLEELSMLYVAMTRARQGLYMLVKPPSVKKNGEASDNIPRSHAGVLRCAFDQPVPKPDSVLSATGNAEWFVEAQQRITVELRTDMAKPAPPRYKPIQLRPSSDRTRTLRSTPSAPPSMHADDHAPLWLSASTNATDRGTAIHLLFEQIEWIEEFTVDEPALTRLIRHRLPRRGPEWAQQLVSDFTQMIEDPNVRAILSKSPRPSQAGGREVGRLRVLREQRFARMTEGGVQQGVIDRLIVEEDESNTPIRADIIDFKTDKIEASIAGECALGYATQLNTYRDAVGRLYGLDNSRITAIVLYVTPGVAVNIQSAQDSSSPATP